MRLIYALRCTTMTIDPETRQLSSSLRREMHANFPYTVFLYTQSEMRFLIARYRPLFRHVEFVGEQGVHNAFGLSQRIV